MILFNTLEGELHVLLVQLNQTSLMCMCMFLFSLVSLESNPIDEGLPWDATLTLGSVSAPEVESFKFLDFSTFGRLSNLEKLMRKTWPSIRKCDENHGFLFSYG